MNELEWNGRNEIEENLELLLSIVFTLQNLQ